MGGIIRLLGIVTMIGGVGAAVGGGNAIIDPILNTVRSFVATYELNIIRDRMISENEGFGQFPEPGDDEALKEFIYETMKHSERGRDPSLDPWDEPYRFDEGGSGDWYVLSSTGPNLDADDCVDAGSDMGADGDEGGGAADDVCAWLELGRSDSAYKPMR